MTLGDAPVAAPLTTRMPWLARACDCLLDDDSDVDDRLIACDLLAGAVGRRAIEALVHALDHGAARVRSRAVSALVTSSQDAHAPRLVHAALHRRADVRRAALQEALPASLLLALLGDVELADEARARVVARATLEPAVLATAIVARRRGQLDDATLIAIARALPWHACATFVRALPTGAPSTATTPTTLAARLRNLGDDHLVDLMGVVASDDDVAAIATAGLVAAIRRRELDSDDVGRIAVAVVVAAAGRGGIAPALLAIAANGFVEVLADDSIALDDRRAACRALVACGVPRHPDVFQALAHTDLWTTDGGFLDLDVVAGLQRLCIEKPYAWLDGSVSSTRFAKAFVTTPTPSVLSLPPTNAADRLSANTLVRAVAEQWRLDGADDHAPAASVLADIVTRVAEPLPLIEQLDVIEAGLAMRVLAAVLDLGDVVDPGADDAAVAERRRERAIEVLVRRQPWPSLAGLLRQATQQLSTSPLARVLVSTIGRILELPHLATLVDGLAARDRHAAIDVIVDVLPPLPSSPDDATASDEGDGLLAVLRRRSHGPRPLDDDERARIAAADDASIGRMALTLVGGRRRTGVCAALAQRGKLPLDATVAAALLASHDPPAVVAEALVPLLSAVERTAVARELARLPPRSLTLLGIVFLDDATGLDALFVEVKDAPGGLRGVITLALYLPTPVDLAVLDAVLRVARSAAFAGRPSPSSIFDERLRTSLRTALAEAATVGPSRERLLSLLTLAGGATDVASVAAADNNDDGTVVFGDDDDAFARWLHRTDPGALLPIISDALVAGRLATPRLLALLKAADGDRGDVVIEAIRGHHDDEGIAALLKLLPLRTSSSQRLERLREVAAWGARQSIVLVGRPLGVTFIGDALGYTRLRSSRIHINPLPVLLDDRDGADIVMGLMVHELGHHRYHGDAVGLRVWEQAHTERLQQVLNLVADEHLERNLRALSPTRYGHRLQHLAAWAFQHRRKELELSTVLSSLGARAAPVLTRQPIGVGRRPGTIVVDIGGAMTALEQQGSPFARFMRALRMGKGDRFGDVVVARALALFPAATFRQLEMPGLLAIARQLREIFGDELSLLQAFDFHQVTDASEGELLASGVSADDLDEAGGMPRAPRRAAPRTSAGTGSGERGSINTDADTHFDVIDDVVIVDVDAAAHAMVAAAVQRPAHTLRRSLLALGQGLASDRRRLTGRRVDRGNLVNVVVRNDPRLLVSRRRQPVADVFIGVVIDCSGSMSGPHLERAQHFATVVAEAVRGIDAVDARFFGFTDTTIFDAGDARRCAVTSLTTDGGNNDAAGLWHASRVALRSRRQVKLLVMISDGAPTECSVDALAALVARLGRRGVVCAQVAVATLDAVCFPHHVLLDDDDDLAGAVRRFAVVIERLVQLGVGSVRRAGPTTSYTRHDDIGIDDDDREQR